MCLWIVECVCELLNVFKSWWMWLIYIRSTLDLHSSYIQLEVLNVTVSCWMWLWSVQWICMVMNVSLEVSVEFLWNFKSACEVLNRTTKCPIWTFGLVLKLSVRGKWSVESFNHVLQCCVCIKETNECIMIYKQPAFGTQVQVQ